MEPSTVSDWRDVYVQARQLREEVGETVLLAPVGDPARTAARRAQALFTAGEVALRPLPTVGEPEAELRLALGAVHLRCALVVHTAPTGFALRPSGDCAPASPPPEAGLLPPRLAIGTRRGDPTWLVRTEGGAPIDAFRFAALTGDDALRERLVAERRHHRTARQVLVGAGLGLIGGAVLPLAASFGAEPTVVEDRRLTSLFLVVSGGAALLGAHWDRRGLDARQELVARYVHPTDAARAVAAWNDRVAQQEAAAAARAAEAAEAEEAAAEPGPAAEPSPAEAP